jgi:hypothetical protein
MDGRHKAGHDDQGVGRSVANDRGPSDRLTIVAGYPTDHIAIVMAVTGSSSGQALVPAIHDLLLCRAAIVR